MAQRFMKIGDAPDVVELVELTCGNSQAGHALNVVEQVSETSL